MRERAMAYLLAWRMALAKDLLRRDGTLTVAEVATRVGSGSASTFSVPFSRHVGRPPTHHAARGGGGGWKRRPPGPDARVVARPEHLRERCRAPC
jgi:AraC-like DNA-binding protein